jgi:hypothetical protein
MPSIDEDILRDLLHRGTDDLHAPAGVTTAVVAGQRRRQQRQRALGLGAAGVAGGVAVALVAVGTGGAAARGPARASAGSAITLTAAQQTLSHFSTVAARTAGPKGRYVVFAEKAGDLAAGLDVYTRTSVIDSVNGDVWTYQKGAGVSSSLPEVHGSTTEAQYDAMPTSLPALKATLITESNQAKAAGIKAIKAQLATLPARLRSKKNLDVGAQFLRENASDKVFDAAQEMLWNPLVGPALKSALFKLLEETPGVVVNQHATDSSGRAAVEISRHQTYGPVDLQVFVNPAGTKVLETASVWPKSSENSEDLYLSITRSATRPANPYQH